MPRKASGVVQSNKKGFRVRVTVAYKDTYGPLRPTLELAQLDLAKLHAERAVAKKKAVLMQLKADVGVRRGGRRWLTCTEDPYMY